MKIRRIDTTLDLPAYAEGAAGMDLISREQVTIPPGSIGLVPVNIVVQVPDGHTLLIFARSSTPLRKGLVLANGVGVVDPFYCGNDDEVVVQFLNISKEEVTVERGDKLAQAMLVKHEPVTWEEVSTMSSKGVGGYWAITGK